jgi:TonB family protein
MITAVLTASLLAVSAPPPDVPGAATSPAPDSAPLFVMILTGRPEVASSNNASDSGVVVQVDEAESTGMPEMIKLMGKIKEAYRLKDLDTQVYDVARSFGVGVPQIVRHSGTAIAAEVTLQGLAPAPTYHVNLRQNDRLLANATVTVPAGKGRAVVGAPGDEKAPYIFVVLQSQSARSGGPTRPIAVTKIKHVRPAYPAEARAARVEGTVALRVEIDKEGHIKDAKVTKGIDGELGAKLNQAAVDAVRQWEYEPPLDDKGQPTEREFGVTVSFRSQ